MGPITVQRFFGGAGLAKNGVQFAFIIEGVLYLRVDEASRATLAAMGSRPFSYRGKAKMVTVAAYYEAPDEVLSDAAELLRWSKAALRAAAGATVKTGAKSATARRAPTRTRT